VNRTLVAAVVAFTAVVGLVVPPADAGSVGVRRVGSAVGTVPANDPRLNEVAPNDPRVVRPIPNDPRVTVPQFSEPAPRPDGDGRRGRHHDEPAPQFIIVQPPYVPAPGCWTPGYWDYQWAPQTATSSVWVPDQWSPAGQWMPGHYDSQVVDSGYWQPIWIPGRWGC
jgi:hypothetical protein